VLRKNTFIPHYYFRVFAINQDVDSGLNDLSNLMDEL
jgi:hypothetical protein